MAPPLPPSYGYEDGEEYGRRRREGYNVEQREGIITPTCIRSEGVRVSVFSGLPNLERDYLYTSFVLYAIFTTLCTYFFVLRHSNVLPLPPTNSKIVMIFSLT